MSTIQSEYVASDGSRLEFSRGNFDEWCVWEINVDGQRYAPRDVDYFRTLQALAEKLGPGQVYSDFLAVYDLAGTHVTQEGKAAAKNSSLKYGELSALAEKTFMVLLMGMIAENNKQNTRLGKRIKRLGVYNLLFVRNDVNHAANFMRGMKWQQIDKLCRDLGF